jgi:type IV secretory pathway VirB2 component (pilin)
MKTQNMRTRLLQSTAVVGATAVALPGQVLAAQTGMPWEAGIQQIFNSLTGPIVGWLAIIVIIIAGVILTFGNMEGGAKKIVFAVIGVAVVAGAPALAAQLGIVQGAVI